VSYSAFFLSGFPTNICANFLFLSCVLHAPPTSFSLIWSSYEAPYVFFSILVFRHISLSSAPCSQTPSTYVLSLIWETKFHTRTKQVKLNFLDRAWKDQVFWTECSEQLKRWFVLRFLFGDVCCFVLLLKQSISVFGHHNKHYKLYYIIFLSDKSVLKQALSDTAFFDQCPQVK
jgi:hypothetical protein